MKFIVQNGERLTFGTRKEDRRRYAEGDEVEMTLRQAEESGLLGRVLRRADGKDGGESATS